jgi:hypothetical protein
VFVDGNLRGMTPLPPIELPSGPHSVLVVNGELHADRSFVVQVRPSEQTVLRVALDAEAH